MSESTKHKIKLKCRFENDIRLSVISVDLPFPKLKKRLSSEYGFDVSLKYEDKEGDYITLACQNDFDAMLLDRADVYNIYVTELCLPSVHGSRQPKSFSPILTNPLPDVTTAVNSSKAPTILPLHHNKSSNTNLNKTEKFPNIADIPISPRGNIRWKQGEMIGQGAFGVVYLGLNIDSGELMAVKQISIEEVSTRELSSLQNEISLLKTLRHPNIVRYIGTDITPTTLSILLEYVPGGSIKSVIDKFGKLEENVVRSYTRQLLLGLEYLHRNGIAHRDIKGGNCLVGNDGVIKLADFGASMYWRTNAAATLAAQASGSGRMSDVRGTPSWMAPEVIQDKDKNLSWKKADVWSLGCTAIEMITGKPPWSQFNNPVTVLYHIACSDALPAYPDNISIELKTFLNICLQRDPVCRPDIASLLLHPFALAYGGNRGGTVNSAIRPSTVSTAPFTEWDNSITRRSGNNVPNPPDKANPNSRRPSKTLESLPIPHLMPPPESVEPTQPSARSSEVTVNRQEIKSSLSKMSNEVGYKNDILSGSFESIEIGAEIVNDNESLTHEFDQLEASTQGRESPDADHLHLKPTLSPELVGYESDENMALKQANVDIMNEKGDSRQEKAISKLTKSSFHRKAPGSGHLKNRNNKDSSNKLISKVKQNEKVRANSANERKFDPKMNNDVKQKDSFEHITPFKFSSKPTESPPIVDQNKNDMVNDMDCDSLNSDPKEVQLWTNNNSDDDIEELYDEGGGIMMDNDSIAAEVLSDNEEDAMEKMFERKFINDFPGADGYKESDKKMDYDFAKHQNRKGDTRLASPMKRSQMDNYTLVGQSINGNTSLLANQPFPGAVPNSRKQNSRSQNRGNLSSTATMRPAKSMSKLTHSMADVDVAKSLEVSGDSIELLGTKQINFPDDGRIPLFKLETSTGTMGYEEVPPPPPEVTFNESILDEHSSGIVRMRAQACRNEFVSSSLDGIIKIWSGEENENVSKISLDSNSFINISKGGEAPLVKARITTLWINDTLGDQIWSGGNDGNLRMWAGEDCKPLRLLKGHEDAVSALEGSCSDNSMSNLNFVASGGLDKTVRIWDYRSKKGQVVMFKGHNDGINSLKWLEGGRSVVSASKDKTIKIWDTRAGRLRMTMDKHFGSVTQLKLLNNDGNVKRGVQQDNAAFVSAGKDGLICVWAESGECIFSQQAHRGIINTVSEIKPMSGPQTLSSKYLISVGTDNIIKIWDLRKFKLDAEIPAHTINKVAWFQNSFVTCSSNGPIKLWELKSSHAQSLEMSSDRNDVLEWTSRDLLSNNVPCSDIICTNSYIAAGLKNGQIYRWAASTS